MSSAPAAAQSPVGPGADVGDEREVVAALRPDRRRARYSGEAADAAELRALIGQRLSENQRLGAALTPGHQVPWPDMAAQVKRGRIGDLQGHPASLRVTTGSLTGI